MFSSYNFSNSKKDVAVSSTLRQEPINALIKALNLKIVTSYTGNEGESAILKKEQAEDDNREKRIQELNNRIGKISKEDKSKAVDLKNHILQKEKIIELIGSEIKNLTARKNKAIKLYAKEKGIEAVKNESVEQFEEDRKSDLLYLQSQQEYLSGVYVTEEKSQLEKKFKDLKSINGQESLVVDEIKGRLTTILSANDNNNYNTVIEKLQNLITHLNVTKNADHQALKDMDAVKIAKKLSTQKALLQQYKEYRNENKKGSAQVQMSPAYNRTRLVMEASMLRAQLNKKVVERVGQKVQQLPLTGSYLKNNVNQTDLSPINFAAQYCIAKLEQVDASVQETLQKKCIDVGWTLDKQKGLIYKSNQSSILLMSDIYELSYNAYIEMGQRQLAEKPEINLPEPQIALLKPTELQAQKRMLPAFEKEIKKSNPKPAHKTNLWSFCLKKALMAVKPEVIGLRDLKASLCEASKNKLCVAA